MKILNLRIGTAAAFPESVTAYQNKLISFLVQVYDRLNIREHTCMNSYQQQQASLWAAVSLCNTLFKKKQNESNTYQDTTSGKLNDMPHVTT